MHEGPPASRWRVRISRRRFPLLLVLALCGAVVLAAVLVLTGRDEEQGGFRDGPLDTFESNGLSNGVPVGRSDTYALPVVFNRGDQALTLRGASFARPTPGLELLDVMVAGSKRGFAYVSGDPRYPGDPRGFRDLSDLHPVEGFRVEPMSTSAGERGVELVFVFRAMREGSYRSRGVDVEYEVGGEEYREVFPNSYLACVGEPPVRKIPRCGRAKPGLELPKQEDG